MAARTGLDVLVVSAAEDESGAVARERRTALESDE
jgi:hypothetical protein